MDANGKHQNQSAGKGEAVASVLVMNRNNERGAKEDMPHLRYVC